MDFIVLFTNICVKAVQNNVCIIAICIMLNHFHIEAEFESSKAMYRFMNGLTSVVARAQNRYYHLSGQVFKKSFKNAPKFSTRKIKDNFIYIGNNPIEKNATSRPEEYRWNFIKYLDSPTPFSEPVDPMTASELLINLIREVKRYHEEGKAIGYKSLKNIYKLDKKEQNQLVDFIVSTYSVIDKKKVIAIFGSYEELLTAINSVTGSEYDIFDEETGDNYRHYYEMIKISKEEGFDLNEMHFSEKTRNDERIKKLSYRFMTEANASEYEVAKFFHLL